MKIVTDGNDLYAIRWGIWPFYHYFDLETPGYWWTKSSRFYPCCFASKDKAEAWFGILNPKISAIILIKKGKYYEDSK